MPALLAAARCPARLAREAAYAMVSLTTHHWVAVHEHPVPEELVHRLDESFRVIVLEWIEQMHEILAKVGRWSDDGDL